MAKTLADSNFGQILTQIETAIEGLALDRIASNVEIRKKLHLKDISTPCAILTHRKLRPSGRGGTNTDDYLYPVVVALFLGTNRDLVDDYAYSLHWEETIRKHFHNRRRITLTTGDTALNCTVQPGETILAEQFMQNYDATFLVISTHVREQRSA